MKNRIKTLIFIILYAIIGIVSMCHAIEFMNMTSVKWQAIMLAFGFEVAQAYTLFHILTTKKNTWRAYTLMILTTIVQVIGNVFACYYYMKTDTESIVPYFAEIVAFFGEMITDEPMDQRTCYITISILVGALLPIMALLTTDMAVDQMNNDEADDKNPDIPEQIPGKIAASIPSPAEEIPDVRPDKEEVTEQVPEQTPVKKRTSKHLIL